MQGRKNRGTTQLEEKSSNLKKLTVLTVLCYDKKFTEKARGCNSFFYVCQLSPPLTLYLQG
jgi:hypothetical protein